jgi:DNA-binding NtrC family response regulator
MSQGTLRAALYYRLKVIHIAMPPLRDMSEDIPLLSAYFLEWFARELGKGRLELTHEAMHSLGSYDWPGNVSELAHEMKRLVVLTRGPHVTAADLSPEIQSASRSNGRLRRPPPIEISLKAAVEELEQHMLQEALMASGNNRVRTARRLGLSCLGLIKKLPYKDSRSTFLMAMTAPTIAH